MELLADLLQLVLHFDQVLPRWLAEYGNWVYLILFLIVFCETGLVVTPLLPGDSLLFVAGALAATGGLDIGLLAALLILAALCGDVVNYNVGGWLKQRVHSGQLARWIKPAYLARTEDFYARHGGKTVILARFVPIVRTYAPFVAGLGAMRFPRYFAFCVAAALLWVGSMAGLGYFFGNLPWVKSNLPLVALGIVVLSITPALYGLVRHRLMARSAV